MPEDHHHRTPMAWQHRNQINGYLPSPVMEASRSSNGGTIRNGKYLGSSLPHHPLAAPSTPGSHRYNGGMGSKAPNTPSSAHSRATLRTEGRRIDHLDNTRDRYTHDGRSSKGAPSHHRHSKPPTGRHRSGGKAGPSSCSSTHNHHHHHHSPSSTDDTVEETTETESQMNHEMSRSEYGRHAVVHGLPPPYPVVYPTPPPQQPLMAPSNPFLGGPQQQLLMAPNGSIRSVHSMPVLAPGGSSTWDGEPCPVHHAQALPLAALYGLGRPAHSSVPPSVISGPATVKRARSVAEMSALGRLDSKSSFHGSMSLNSTHPRIVLSENGTPSTLPVRELSKSRNGTLLRGAPQTPMRSEKPPSDIHCCSGSFIVMWIILGIITFGILLGIVLKFTVS